MCDEPGFRGEAVTQLCQSGCDPRKRAVRQVPFPVVLRLSPRSAAVSWRIVALAAAPALCALSAGSGTAAAAVCSTSVDPPSAAATPSPLAPCLVEVEPYPFGDSGEPVDPTITRCALPSRPCHLDVTSFAFRAWNRGLAATRGTPAAPGLWLWNGRSWSPDPTFPGTGTCPGTKVLWAGKLDYWTVGTSAAWGRLCRFDGSSFQWQPLSVPTATLDRVIDFDPATGLPRIENGQVRRKNGGITSGACQAWNDCWFFGDHGTVLRWNGTTLTDASPDYAGAPWLQTAFRSAVARRDAAGNPFGFAVGLSTVTSPGTAVPPNPDGSPPPQGFSSDGGPFGPLFAAPPFTDLMAVDADASGRAWTAGVPAPPGSPTGVSPVTVTTRQGPDPSCPGSSFPGGGTGTFYRWSSLVTIPDADAALVGGQSVDSQGRQLMLARVACTGTVTETTFTLTQPGHGTGRRPFFGADGITALAATASNDAWVVLPRGEFASNEFLAPVLLRLQDGRPPQAPAGDDIEDRAVVFTDDSPLPAGTPSPSVEPPAKLPKFFRFTSRFSKGTLTINFRVRRPGLIGIQALRKGRVVATTGLRRVRPPRGVLRLKFDPKAWPTKIEIITDAPSGIIKRPAKVLRGTVRFVAQAEAIKGRRVSSVRWDYAPAGSDEWREISTSIGRAPYRLAFATTQLVDGRYDFRIVVTDSKGEEAISPVVRRQVTNGITAAP